jgi:hypothetical protein
MSKVYVLMSGYSYEGEQIISAHSSLEAAVARRSDETSKEDHAEFYAIYVLTLDGEDAPTELFDHGADGTITLSEFQSARQKSKEASDDRASSANDD